MHASQEYRLRESPNNCFYINTIMSNHKTVCMRMCSCATLTESCHQLISHENNHLLSWKTNGVLSTIFSNPSFRNLFPYDPRINITDTNIWKIRIKTYLIYLPVLKSPLIKAREFPNLMFTYKEFTINN